MTKPVHAMLLSFSVKFRRNLIHNTHDAGGIPTPVEYQEDFNTVQGIDEVEGSANETVAVTPELVRLENFIAQTTV